MLPFPKWNLFLIFFHLQLFLHLLARADPRISEAGVNCGTVRTTPQQIIPDFVRQMEGLSLVVDKQGWGTYEFGSNPTLYSLAQCMGDLSHTDCLLCFTEARTKLPRCLPSVAARVHLDGCFLRWDNYSFYHESIDDQLDTGVCNSSNALPTDSLRLEFSDAAKELIDNVTKTAVSSGGFAVGEWKTGAFGVYALAQCWHTVNNTGCRMCLEKAAREVNRCLPGREGRGLNVGCYLRYSTEKFYNDVELPKNGRRIFSFGVIIATVIAAFACLTLSVFGGCLAYKRLSIKSKERVGLGRLSSAVSKSNLNFKYETLEKATEFFKPSRKLGQGGAGSVFKGTLPDGRNVAVKRLFFNTRQWVDEFFNEVNLISGIQHKNLVKLLGCSIEGPESLLVYEYVVNKSIDHVLFGKSTTDKSSAQFLNWQQRLHIIVGTAEGLAYLHGGTQTRIIHRDIKCSNVLLDENMNAKIADFGLARMFAPDKSHLSTGIAGTLGYMAPEYLVRGQLTEKADVYSFGVLLLEILCGRKNTVFSPECGSVLQLVWTNYNLNALPQSIDPALKDDFPVKEASDVLQIGLLCTQASASIRPSMPEVIEMLTDRDCAVPLPMQPPFLNSSRINRDSSTMSMSASAKATDSTKSGSMSSLLSASTTVEISETR